MKPFVAAALACAGLAAHANTVFILPPGEMHYPIDQGTIAAVLDEGDAFAKAARLAPLRPSGDFELRLWTSPRPGEGFSRTAYVLTKGRVSVYALKLRGAHLRAVRTSSRRIAPGKAPIAQLRAAWETGGRSGCDVSDYDVALVEGSLDGKPVAFMGMDLDPHLDLWGCTTGPGAAMDALLRFVRALAGY